MANEITNLYEALEDELNVSQTNVDTVLKAIDEKIKKWYVKINNPKYRAIVPIKTKALRNLKAQILDNPDVIKQHAAAYAEIARKKQQQQEKSIREDASIYVVNGQIEEVALAELAKKNFAFSKEEILSIIGATIKKKKEFKYTETSTGRELDPTCFKRFLKDLATVEKRDLYDFLCVPANAPSSLIKQICDEKYAENQKRLANYERVTIDNLVMHCKTLLLDAGKRADYDFTCANQVFADVRQKIEIIASGTDRIIHPEQYKALLEECTKKGMSYDKAEYMIYKTAEQYKVTIIEPAYNSGIQMHCFSSPINSKNITPVLDCGIALSFLHGKNNFILHNVFVKNIPLPCAKMIHTKTVCENQKTICLGIYEHDYTHISTDMIAHMRFLVSKTVQLSKPLPINSPIDILVQVNEEGFLADINIVDVLNDDVIIVKPELDSIH